MMEKAQMADSVEARRKSCGYRIRVSCANCVNCKRTFEGASHAQKMMAAECRLYDFPVNLDRGICRIFDNIGKYRD